MVCYKHPDKDAIGTCVNCGKFICAECNTELQERNYCKECVNKVFTQKMEEKKDSPQQPMVFMNAGGGASSSSSSSSSSSGNFPNRRGPYPKQSAMIHILLLLFTGGIGNIIYYLYIKSQQSKW